MATNTIQVTHTDEFGKKTIIKHNYQGPANAWSIDSALASLGTKLMQTIIQKRDLEKLKNVSE